MTEDFVVYAIREGFVSLLKISMPILSIALVVGLVVSILQAATQVQDNILGYLPKLFVIIVSIAFGFPVGFQILGDYLSNLFMQIPKII